MALDFAKIQALLQIRTAFLREEIDFEEAKKRLKTSTAPLTLTDIAAIEKRFAQDSDLAFTWEAPPDRLADAQAASIATGKVNMPPEQVELFLKKQFVLSLWGSHLATWPGSLPPWHPLLSYYEELNEWEWRLSCLASCPCSIESLLENALLIDDLSTWQKHLSRKQLELYPYLERAGYERPMSVLWRYDDQVKTACKACVKTLEQIREAYNSDEVQLNALLQDFDSKRQNLISKASQLNQRERQVLFPLSYLVLSSNAWEVMAQHQSDHAFAWVTPSLNDFPRPVFHTEKEQTQKSGSANTTLSFNSQAHGQLSPELLEAVLSQLSMELTVVDEKDQFVFFAHDELLGEAIFPRSPAALERPVHLCHPMQIRPMVAVMIEQFQDGSHDYFDRHLRRDGEWIQVRYRALRSKEGQYLGVLETVQRCGHIEAGIKKSGDQA